MADQPSSRILIVGATGTLALVVSLSAGPLPSAGCQKRFHNGLALVDPNVSRLPSGVQMA